MMGKGLDDFYDAVTEAGCDNLCPLIDRGTLTTSVFGAKQIAAMIAKRAAELLFDDEDPPTPPDAAGVAARLAEVANDIAWDAEQAEGGYRFKVEVARMRHWRDTIRECVASLAALEEVAAAAVAYVGSDAGDPAWSDVCDRFEAAVAALGSPFSPGTVAVDAERLAALTEYHAAHMARELAVSSFDDDGLVSATERLVAARDRLAALAAPPSPPAAAGVAARLVELADRLCLLTEREIDNGALDGIEEGMRALAASLAPPKETGR